MVTRATDVMRNPSAGAESIAGNSSGSRERILYVVSSFPTLTETFIVREIHTLLSRGADVRIVALHRRDAPIVQSDARQLMERVVQPNSWYRNLGALVKYLFTRPALTIAFPFRAAHRLWRTPIVLLKTLVTWFRTLGVLHEIEAWAPEHIHAHWATYPSSAAMVMSRYTGCPFSFTAHAHDIFVDDQLMREKLASAAFIATISRFNRKYLKRRYPEAEHARIEIVHCGVPRHVYGEGKYTASPKNRILSVGRLDEVKGFPVLLAACAAMKANGVNFHCEIIGDGPLRGELHASLQELGLQDVVTMSGARPSQEVEHKLAAADVFVLASQRSPQGNMDGIPVALMEAMASGTPVVTTAVSGIPELVQDEQTGLLVQPGDSVALAAAIRRMLKDGSTRTRCIKGAMTRVRNEFDAQQEGEKLHGIIQSIKGKRDVEAIADHH